MASPTKFHPLAPASTLELHQRFMPLIERGALLVSLPSAGGPIPYQLGDPFYLLLQLPGSEERHPLEGTVVWVNPQGDGPRRGVGVQLPAGSPLLSQIERLVQPHLSEDTPNWTF